MRTANYDKTPFIAVNDSAGACVGGWDAIGRRLKQAMPNRFEGRFILAVECYVQVDEPRIIAELSARLRPNLALHTKSALLAPEQIDALVEPFLGGGDPVFGFLSDLTLPQFFDPAKISGLRSQVQNVDAGLVLVVGCGATLLGAPDLLVYADLARWEAQNRFRRNSAANLGVENQTLASSLQYKRAFFVDWRVCDRWKKPLIERWDFLLDTNNPTDPKLADGPAVRRGLRHAVTRPFRVVPFFDPAPWGGQWMKQVCDLDANAINFGWCFDCVVEENSLLLGLGDLRLEIPSIDLVFQHPRQLLGEAIYARFGDEFPIRFDFLDTMGGGNLSWQVHPLAPYMQREFGLRYTQDESYYLLAAAPGASVYLGLREGIDRQQMLTDLAAANSSSIPFDADRYAERWPAAAHDHFLIPAGTVHCSGADAMVLEISATPYIFTFKMWDWQRLGLDGKPRPIHLAHAAANIQWDRTTTWVKQNLINRFEPIAAGPGWREERTGLHELEFIETRRHWFTAPVSHDTGDNLNVLNLVQGEQAIVESPTGAFDPFIVHYAESFIVPAAVGPYTIRPHGSSENQPCATIKAFVRT